MSPDELLLFAVLIAFSIIKGNDEQTLYVLSSFFTTIGSLLNLFYRQYDYLAFLSSSTSTSTSTATAAQKRDLH